MSRLGRLGRGPLPALALLVLAWGAMALRYPGFASGYQTAALVSSNAALGLCAVGMTLVILTGGIDLSVGALHALASLVAALLIERAGLSTFLAVPLVLAGAALFGLAQGLLVTRAGLAPFLVTLVGMFLARGLALVATAEKRISLTDHPAYRALSGARPLGLPLPGWLVLAAVLGAWWLHARTRIGRTMQAAGAAEESARRMGLPVARAKLLAYTLSGLLAGTAGLALALASGTGDALAGNLLELDAIAAAVIGGTTLTGGRGHVLGTLAGFLLLAVITTFPAYQAGFDSVWVRVSIGGLLLAFLLAERLLRRG